MTQPLGAPVTGAVHDRVTVGPLVSTGWLLFSTRALRAKTASPQTAGFLV